MQRIFKKYRDPVVVGALLLLPLLSYLSSGYRGREPNAIDRLVLGVSAPLQRGLTWFVQGVGSTITSYVDLRGARSAAQRCEGELGEVRGELNALRELRAENERLRRVLQVVESGEARGVLARVIGLAATAQFHSLRIDRGERDGIRVGAAVASAEVTPEGVPRGAAVGRVIRAVGGSADVMLLTDASSRIAVVSQRSRVRGTAAGVGDGRRLELRFVGLQEDVKEGDALVTSGTDGVFPRGLLLGHARDVVRPAVGMYITASIVPAADVQHIEEVLVLVDGDSRGEAALAPVPGPARGERPPAVGVSAAVPGGAPRPAPAHPRPGAPLPPGRSPP